MTGDLSARNLAKWGLRRGAYDGANSRRFVLFESTGKGTEWRREYTSKRERDAACAKRLEELRGVTEGWMWLDGAHRWHWIKTDHRSLCGKIACLGLVEGDPSDTNETLHCAGCVKRLARHGKAPGAKRAGA